MKGNFKDIFNVNPKYSTTTGFILGLILIDGLNVVEQNALGEWLVMIGQTLLTNCALQLVIEQRISGNNININSKKFKSIYNPGVYDINKTKELIKKLYPEFKDDVDNLSKMLDDLQKQINNIKKNS